MTILQRLAILHRYTVVSRWHDYLEFQARNTYRIVGELDPEGEWVKWSDIENLIKEHNANHTTD